MNINGTHYRTIWLKDDDPRTVQIIDQTRLPYEFIILDLKTVDQATYAIKEMQVRGAGLIGAAAGYGMYLSALNAPKSNPTDFVNRLVKDGEKLKSTRPTAINLEWAVQRQLNAVLNAGEINQMVEIARQTAEKIADEDASFCKQIGENGLPIIEKIHHQKNGQTVNILTHCNAGWLAFVDYGSATAPIYAAHDRGIPVHVWVDETRPRNQGARLTAWELAQHGVPHTVIADNTGGHLMQHGMVDLVITGSDRTTYTGDVANKIGTYLKALAARDNDIPFYVALPSSTIDWETQDGLAQIPIEERNAEEVESISGLHEDRVLSVRLMPQESPAANYAFDVTPRRLVTGLITERGVCPANAEDLFRLYPEKQK